MTHPPIAVVPERLETLLVIRLGLPGKLAPDAGALTRLLRRFKPAQLTDAEWAEHIAATLQRLQDHQVITGERRLVRDDEVQRRVGAASATKWEQWTDRLLPALALGIALDDAKALRPLSIAGGWVAAIAARALALWSHGPPPTTSKLGDALVWHELGLSGAAKRCPPEVHAHFLRKHIAATGAPPLLLRQIAAKAVAAASPDLGKLRDSLVRNWLVGRELVGDAEVHAPAPAPPPVPARSLVDDVLAIARAAHGDAVFGDRKVFISRIWDALRREPAWASLALHDFKQRLVAAHRAQQLVLARADLVSAMDPALVEASETRTDGASFHFVEREPTR
jgi:hypothetical protein